MKSDPDNSEQAKQINGERFIVIAENIAFREVLNTIAEALKVKNPTLYAPIWMTEIAWRTDWILSTIFRQKTKFSKDTARASHATILYSNEKVKTTLHHEFRDVKEYITEIVALQSKHSK